MEAKDQLRRLARIQELAIDTAAARAIVERRPVRIEEIEGRFRERNAEYVALKTRFEALEKDQRDRTGELAMLEESLKKYNDNLMQVKNQREYAAVLKEIDAVKSHISIHEEAVLRDLEESGQLKTDLDARTAHISEERALVEKECAQVEAEAEEARQRIAAAEAERARIESELPPDLVESVRRIEDARQGVFLAKVERETCLACHVRVRPQVFQEIRQGLRVHSCSNCRRFLYFDPGPAGEAGNLAAGGPGLEASDRGSV